MPKGKLTDRAVRHKKTAGVWSDGDGLRLRVQLRKRTDSNGVEKEELRRSWVFRFSSPTVTNLTLAARAAEQRQLPAPDPASVANPTKKAVREIGLGSADRVSLAEARRIAGEKRRMIDVEKQDPLEVEAAAEKQRQTEAAARSQQVTFSECAEKFITDKQHEWKSAKHAGQWRATLKTYAYPVIGETPVANIDRALVLAVLDPIWRSRRETANRVRSRIMQVIDWAQGRGHRRDDQANPARWEGPLKQALSGGRRPVKHHAAVPYDDMPQLMQDLRQLGGVGACCLEWLALTAARYAEAAGVVWGELDLTKDAATWTIPVERRKGKLTDAAKRVPLRIPLSARAVEILTARQAALQARGLACDSDRLVFESPMRPGKPLSAEALLKVLREGLKREETSHGFRSTFRTWVSEETTFQREVAEAALGHVIGDKVEAAYQRGDLFKKRRALMAAWAAHCGTPPNTSADVLPLKKPAA